MSLHADALAVLTAWRSPTPAQEALRTMRQVHQAIHDVARRMPTHQAYIDRYCAAEKLPA